LVVAQFKSRPGNGCLSAASGFASSYPVAALSLWRSQVNGFCGASLFTR